MKRNLFSFAALVFITHFGVVHTGRAELQVVVKQQDMLKNLSYSVMSLPEYNALVQEVRKEASVFSLAQRQAETAWKADESNEDRYPGRSLTPRKVFLVSRYSDPEKAQEKVDKYEEQMADREIRDEKKTAEKYKQFRDKEKVLKYKAKAEKRADLLDSANDLLAEKIQAMLEKNASPKK